MLLIPCPWCGVRDETEFRYGGQARIAHPREPASLDDAEWASYLYFRDNPEGPFAERWFHVHGCRRWSDVVRDTGSYAVVGACVPAAHMEGPDTPCASPTCTELRSTGGDDGRSAHHG